MADTEKKTMARRFAGLKSEFSKIVWPEPQSAWKQTVAVLLTSIVIAFIIVILDYIIQYGVDFLVNL
jgi:preprotein translocase subunit SecE